MNNIIIRTTDSLLRKKNFEEAPSVIDIFIDKKKNIDNWMDDFIKQNLHNQFENIFIPTTFGDNACDFLGLRLALHIRTTSTPNQLSNIILYGPETFSEVSLLSNLYQIILTKGVSLVDYNLNTLAAHLKKQRILSNTEELISELKKIEVEIPENYYDSHSISNIWGLYRLCEVAGKEINSVSSLMNQQDKLDHIYFKWLITINKVENIRSKEVVEIDEKFSPASQLRGLTVLGKIELPKDTRKRG